MDEILTNGANILFAHYLGTKTVPHTTNATLAMITNIMEMKYNRMDTGEDEIWKETREPNIAKIDTWGRGSIPVRRVIRHKAVEAPTIVEPDARSRMSKGSKFSAITKGSTMRRSDTIGAEAIEEAEEN